jgi:uncharacterized protein YukE
MAFVGMDPERVRRIAEQLRQSSVRITTIGEDIQRLIDQSVGGWEGVDYQDFTGGWSGQHRLTLQTAATGMETMATSVLEDVAEQEIASGIMPGGPGSSLPPGSVPPGLLDTLSAANLLKGGLSALTGMGTGLWQLYNLNKMRGLLPGVELAAKELAFLRNNIGHGPALAQLAAKYGLTEAQIMAKAGTLSKLTAPLKSPLVAKLGTALAPLAIAGGGYEIYNAITGDGPVDDRIAQGISGGAGIAGGVATIAMAAGLVSNPVGWAIIGGTAVVAGGAWVYQNWDKVTGALDTVGDGIAHGYDVVSDTVSDGLDAAGDALEDVGGGIKDAGGKVLGALGFG